VKSGEDFRLFSAELFCGAVNDLCDSSPFFIHIAQRDLVSREPSLECGALLGFNPAAGVL